MSDVKGFSSKQRQWFLRRDGNRCMFYQYDVGFKRWVRCKNTEELQIHHILARGWCATHMPRQFHVNGPTNGITLCRYHHVGNTRAVHPDTWEALQEYRKGDKGAFSKMRQDREIKNHIGVPYWNTQYDWQFSRLAHKFTSRHLRKNKLDKYPSDKSRGLNGRLKRSKK